MLLFLFRASYDVAEINQYKSSEQCVYQSIFSSNLNETFFYIIYFHHTTIQGTIHVGVTLNIIDNIDYYFGNSSTTVKEYNMKCLWTTLVNEATKTGFYIIKYKTRLMRFIPFTSIYMLCG